MQLKCKATISIPRSCKNKLATLYGQGTVGNEMLPKPAMFVWFQVSKTQLALSALARSSLSLSLSLVIMTSSLILPS